MQQPSLFDCCVFLSSWFKISAFFFLQLFRRVAAALPGMDTTQDKSREDSILFIVSDRTEKTKLGSAVAFLCQIKSFRSTLLLEKSSVAFWRLTFAAGVALKFLPKIYFKIQLKFYLFSKVQSDCLPKDLFGPHHGAKRGLENTLCPFIHPASIINWRISEVLASILAWGCM